MVTAVVVLMSAFDDGFIDMILKRMQKNGIETTAHYL